MKTLRQVLGNYSEEELGQLAQWWSVSDKPAGRWQQNLGALAKGIHNPIAARFAWEQLDAEARQVLHTTLTLSTAAARNPCGVNDVNNDGVVNAADVQAAISQVLGTTACGTAVLGQAGHCAVQRVIKQEKLGRMLHLAVRCANIEAFQRGLRTR